MEEQEEPRPRPRVVDKRVSARPPGEAAPPRPADAAPPPADAPPGPVEPPSPGREAPPPGPQQGAQEGYGPDLWTPEQEEAARRLAQEIRDVPSSEWVLNVAVNLANVAAAKLDAGMAPDAQLAIDALAGIVNATGPRLGSAEAPLRDTLAQLQMAFAQSVSLPSDGPAPPARP
jgi:hypothetical protein